MWRAEEDAFWATGANAAAAPASRAKITDFMIRSIVDESVVKFVRLFGG